MKLKITLTKNFLTLFIILISYNGFSQWKTSEANNIKDDIIITYEVIYDKELSLEEKKSPEYLQEIVIAFNKDKMVERRLSNNVKTQDNYSLFDFNTLKGYICGVLGDIKKGIEYTFNEPKALVEPVSEINSKEFVGFPCEKGITMVDNSPKEIFYTKKIGLRYCKNYKIDGFLMEYPMYSKTLGNYTVRAKTIVYNDLPDSFFSLNGFTIQTEEEVKRLADKSQQKRNELRMKYIGKKAMTFKELTIKNKKIDTKEILGDVIVYNFWFTTCGPCRAEMPYLNQLKGKYKDKNVHFISIALDESYKIDSFLKTTPFDYDIIPDGRWLTEKFDITSYPTNIIIDKKGIIQFFETGYSPKIIEKMTSAIDNYLAE